MKRYRVPLLIALVVIVALAVFVGIRIRAATDGTYRTQRQLEQVPEGHLLYPGSVVIAHFGIDLKFDVLGQRTQAYSGYTLGTEGPEEELFAFYRPRLSAAGWQRSGVDGTLVTNQLRAIVYRKGSLVIQVTTLRRDDIRNPPGVESYRTPYTIVLYADMPK